MMQGSDLLGALASEDLELGHRGGKHATNVIVLDEFLKEKSSFRGIRGGLRYTYYMFGDEIRVGATSPRLTSLQVACTWRKA